MDNRFGFSTPCEEVITAFGSQVKGRTFVITGTSQGGLGGQAALALANANPAHIILITRNKSRSEPIMAEIAKTSASTKTTFVPCSLDDLDSVRAAAASILDDASIPKIDVLLNNAGVMAIPSYTTNRHGVEMTLAANHIGHFLLTNLLLPKILAAGPGSRIVNHSSKGHKISPFRFHDPNFGYPEGKTYDPWSAYGQSKTANILFTTALNARFQNRQCGTTALTCHPGSIYGTTLSGHLDEDDIERAAPEATMRNNGRTFEMDRPKNLSQGASTMLVAALDPALEGQGDRWLVDCRVQGVVELDEEDEGQFGGWVEDDRGGSHVEPVYAYAVDGANAERLWTVSESLSVRSSSGDEQGIGREEGRVGVCSGM